MQIREVADRQHCLAILRSGGWGSDLQRDEAAFLVLDGAMVCTAGILLTVFHPGFCFSQLSNVSPRRAVDRVPGDADIVISPINDSLGDVRMATEDLRRRQKRHRLMKRIVNLASLLLRQSHRRRHWSRELRRDSRGPVICLRWAEA